MKKIIIPILLLFSLMSIAQNKKPSLALHYSFTDLKTPINFQTSSDWAKFTEMDAGYGISYWQGLHPNIDLNGGINYTKSIYTVPVTLYANTESLFTLEAKGVFKLFAENKYPVTPYLSLGGGLYSNAGQTGFYTPVGLGIHINLKKEAFVFSEISYRTAFSSNKNDSFFYGIGIGTSLTRDKKPKQVVVEPVVIPEPKPLTKDVAIWVKDLETGVPLPNVEVTLTSAEGAEFTGKTDSDGKLTLSDIVKNDYAVRGELHDVVTESKMLETTMFDALDSSISLILIHNDPRFTLTGKAVKKLGGDPVPDVQVSVKNLTRASLDMVKSKEDGYFEAQLEGASDFSISGKKAGFISNIEELSTKGLNRSETLYVKLELEIQEAREGTQIVMNNIFFETGKANLNTAASTDLNRLVIYMQDNPSARVEIQGHTDSTGSVAINNKLSQDRANSVVRYLVSQGISNSRLSAKGFGSSQPVDTNATAEGRANNRRVEIKILGE